MSRETLRKEIKENEGLIFSTDTLNIEDLLTSAYTLLKVYNIKTPIRARIKSIFTKEPTNNNYFYGRTQIKEEYDDGTAQYLLNEYVFDLFGELSPNGYYFGTSEGDGACFGWFQYEVNQGHDGTRC